MKRVSSKMKISNCYHFVTNLILIAFFSIFICSCAKDDDQSPVNPTPVTPVGISQEIKDLIYFKGNKSAPTVLINAQAGPDIELGTDLVDNIFENFNTTDILTVNVHQAQTLNPTILQGNDITLAQAVSFNTESIETLYQVIKYFKDQGRTVYVLGISFGAFITQELIAKKGIDSADKYLIITGRLDINDVVWQGLSEGRFGFFENGVTPIVDPEPGMDVIERNIGRLAAGLGMNRYTQLLNTVNDLSNLTYIYGATDQAVGSLTAEEVAFLESKNANILTGNGGHDTPFIGFFKQGLSEAFGIE